VTDPDQPQDLCQVAGRVLVRALDQVIVQGSAQVKDWGQARWGQVRLDQDRVQSDQAQSDWVRSD
jgi:hypothetical protein